MARVRQKDTGPEIAVRRALWSLGFRYRLHVKSLPGTPDIVMRKHKVVIFVHGCFWHQHPGCRRAGRPNTNTTFWNAKLDANVRRDHAAMGLLTNAGWHVVVIWECEAKHTSDTRGRLKELLHDLTINPPLSV